MKRKLAQGGRDRSHKRQFFSYVKQKTKSRPTIGPLKDKNGVTVKDDKNMAEVLNRFFGEVFTREDLTEVPEPERLNFGEGLDMVHITRKKVENKIKKLRDEAAAGPDGLGPRLLKELSAAIASPLATIMRRSLPKDWKSANVTPIFKKRPKSSLGNYRPGSLTSVSCKILESIIKDDITQFLVKKKLIRSSQHGFVKGRSCTSNILEFLEKVTAAVDSGESVDVIFLDFAKAFDKVPRERLLKKLRVHGLSGNLLRWIREWLTNRSQRVVLNGNFSDWIAVLSGVPQGSVLGPLLFLIFINDLDCAVREGNILNKFADDTKVAQVIRSDADRDSLQAALDRLVTWSNLWGMEFNVAKCKVMHVGRGNPEHNYSMNGQQLGVTVEERDLGVIMSKNLKPAAQCAKAAKTAQVVLGQISRSFQYRDKLTFVQLYKQYVGPYLEFSSQTWSPWLKADIDTLEKVQQRAVRMGSGLRATGYEDRLKELGMVTLEERRHQADMLHMYKMITGKDTTDPSTWFRMAANGPRQTRNAAAPMNVQANHGRLELRRNFFSVRVTDAWNRVPAGIKMLKTVDGFKNGYKAHRLIN